METNRTILFQEVVSLENRKSLGSVTEVLIDGGRKCVGFFLVNDEKQSRLSLLPWEGIIGIGDTYITIQNEGALIDANEEPGRRTIADMCNLVGLEVFSRRGNKVGRVRSFDFNTITGAIETVHLVDEKSYPVSKIIFMASSFMFVEELHPSVVRADLKELRTVKGDVFDTKSEVVKKAQAAEEEIRAAMLEVITATDLEQKKQVFTESRPAETPSAVTAEKTFTNTESAKAPESAKSTEPLAVSAPQSVEPAAKSAVAPETSQTINSAKAAENLAKPAVTSESTNEIKVISTNQNGSMYIDFRDLEESNGFVEVANEDEALFDLLRGAILSDDVVSADGTFVVRKGTVLTDELLLEAQKHDSLVLLTISVDV